MKSFGSYLMLMFMIMFWVFRIMVAVMFTFGFDFIVEPFNINIEIALLFGVLACILLVLKRKVIGGIAYLGVQLIYFGPNLYQQIMTIMENNGSVDPNAMMEILVSFVAVILGFAVFFELLLDRNRKTHPVDKKTDWFYKNEQFDRKMDERADKNNYRTM